MVMGHLNSPVRVTMDNAAFQSQNSFTSNSSYGGSQTSRPSLMPHEAPKPRKAVPQSTRAKNDLQSLLHTCFTIFECLYAEFDQDGSGDLPFTQMSFQLRQRGLKDPDALKQLFDEYVDFNKNGKVDFLEFLLVMYYWSLQQGNYQSLLDDPGMVQTLDNGMAALVKAYEVYDVNNDTVLSHDEMEVLFSEMLPELGSPRPLLAKMRLSDPVGFGEVLRVMYISVCGTGFLKLCSRLRIDRHDLEAQVGNIATKKQCEQFIQTVTQGLMMMEEDFDNMSSHRQFISLEDLLHSSEHRLEQRSPVEKPCESCSTIGCHFYCPFAMCAFNVCSDCYGRGMQSHLIPNGGLGSKKKRVATQELLRSTFGKLDTHSTGYLNYMEYVTLCVFFCKYTSYCDLAHECRDPGLVKHALMSISKQLTQHDKGRTGGISQDDLKKIVLLIYNQIPSNISKWYKVLAQDGQLKLLGFVNILYIINCPAGKYLSMPQQKPRLQIRQIQSNPQDLPRNASWRQNQIDRSQVDLIMRLAEGTGVVYWKALYNGNVCVAKIPDRNTLPNVRQAMLKAAVLQQRVQHPCVEAVLGICPIPGQEMVLLEFLPSGNLQGLYQKYSTGVLMRGNPLSPKLQWRVARQLADAVLACHDAGIMHRDVCGAVLSLDKQLQVKLSGFVWNCVTDQRKAVGRVGTLGFMAPEVLRNDGQPYDLMCDVFSFGCTLYEITHNSTPFAEFDPKMSEDQLIRQMKGLFLGGQRPKLDPKRIPQGMKEIILWCWGDAPYSRPTMSQVCDKLEAIKGEYDIW